jgi:hypothetical protein
MRLMYSGRDFAWIYERQDQISFLDGHVRAFAHFDHVPARVAYDNLRAVVVRILVGAALRDGVVGAAWRPAAVRHRSVSSRSVSRLPTPLTEAVCRRI